MNILDKIFNIMNEYEDLLLNIDINSNIDNKDDITDEDITNNKNILSEQMKDNFFKYIFENINIKNISQKNNEDSSISSLQLNNTINLSERLTADKELFSEANAKEHSSTEKDENKKLDSPLLEDENIENKLNDNDIILEFIKKIYKKIIIKCHPDKGGDKKLFLKCQEYYENKFIIGILYIGYIIKFKLPLLDEKIIKQILFEIRVIQQKIIYLKMKFKKIY